MYVLSLNPVTIHNSRSWAKKEPGYVTANLSFDYPLISGCDNIEKGVIKKAIPDVVTKARGKEMVVSEQAYQE